MEFRKRRGEFPIGGHRAEQRHRRTELKVVGTVEDLADCAILDGVDECRALPKPRSQNPMPGIGRRFVAGATVT
jgi:hypothetical protein